MTELDGVLVVRCVGGRFGPLRTRLAGLLAAYHLRTEDEKGVPVGEVAGLPDRYRAEVQAPEVAFGGDVVMVAVRGGEPVGCVVVTGSVTCSATGSVGGCVELRRLWTDPAHRGQGIASALIRSAVTEATRAGADTVRLSVWSWRAEAIALYERLGFTVADSWDARGELVCLQRPSGVRPDPAGEPVTALELRAATSADGPFLTQLLLAAVNWSPERSLPLARVLGDPELAHYVDGWSRPGDDGVVATADGRPVGAAWWRLFPATDPGYGFVAADIPELSMAVVAHWRGRGVGRILLRAAKDAAASRHQRLSLSVERANPAQDLYLSEGFRVVSRGPDSDTMVNDLTWAGEPE